MLGSMKQDQDRIESDIASIVYYCNGGVNFTDAYALTDEQLSRLSNVITKHHEAQAEAMNPKGPKKL